MSKARSRTPRRRSDLWRRLPDGTFEALSASGRLVRLNASAFSIWQWADGRRDVGDIVDLAAARFGLPAASLEPEVMDALKAMERRKILVLNWRPL